MKGAPHMTINPIAPVSHLYILIDRSGSMSSIVNDVIGGFNELIANQGRDGSDARVTLVQFDSQDPQDVIVAGANISEICNLDGHSYIPRGGTPLLDATGLLIGRGRVEQASRAATGLPKENIVFVTITDGEENQSHEYDLDRIRTLVKECEDDHDWTFVFLSAGLDAYAEAGRVGVSVGSSQSFSPSSVGTVLAFKSLDTNLKNFRDKKRRHETTDKHKFFESKEAEDQRNEDEN